MAYSTAATAKTSTRCRPQDGNFKWKFNINKDGKAGKITGEKAWAVNVEQSSESLLGTKTTTWSNPRRILRTDYRDTHFVVFRDKQIIRVNKEDGALAWSHKWKYDPNQRRLQFDPTYVGDNDDIVYACNGFYGIDGKTGEIKWEDKDVEGEYTQVADDLLVVRKKDKVRGYSLK
ncbi:MAG: outer membrane protein assembly factor BamB family protein [Candidatus Latescibacterota bacterium]|jgi:outer membrane protein assembly factor BamB